MIILIHIVAALHLAVYLGIMYYGWQSYKLLRKRSWRFMGVGFTVLLVYRTWRFVEQLFTEHVNDAEGTLLPFIGALFLLIAFWMLCHEHRDLINKLTESPSPLRSGAQPVEFWKEESRKALIEFRAIVREEIAAASGKTTVTVTGPSAATTEAP
jgi:hypothetical protein